jgi:hypothetical protein
MAARDVLRLEHAMQRFRQYLDDLTVQGAPVALERVEDVVARWAAEDE